GRLARARTLRAALASAERHAQALERELQSLRRTHLQLVDDHQFLGQFLRSLPTLTRSLLGGASEREIPDLLVGALRRELGCSRAMVLLRRRPTAADPLRGNRLVVAAVQPKDPSIEPGAEVQMSQGELGFAATTQRVLTRQDLDSEAPPTRQRLRQETPRGFEFELLAPIVCDEETLGLVAASGVSHSPEDAKAVARLLAQMAGQALRTAQALSQMKNTADVDGLTGILNKRHLTEVLAERVFDAQRELTPLAVFLFDIDSFKHYNDSHGHMAGDQLLRELTRLVAENIRKQDLFGRFGGEEFLLVLPKTPLAHALAVAEKIRATIAAHAFPFAEAQPLGFLSVSGGVAECPRDGLDSNRLLAAADEALYRAKRAGRNQVLPAERFDLSEGEVVVVGGPGGRK
ncbi:MAG TPA: sensor domain-containing diguanylate cyclase, partial [Vicinamibacteria bacterium]|nr:sensor domain-containing diguanylate cyclase [Vicinamibacteria bacterium]